jgi:hypothetical protein
VDDSGLPDHLRNRLGASETKKKHHLKYTVQIMSVLFRVGDWRLPLPRRWATDSTASGKMPFVVRSCLVYSIKKLRTAPSMSDCMGTPIVDDSLNAVVGFITVLASE